MKKSVLLTIILAFCVSLSFAQEPSKQMASKAPQNENGCQNKPGDCMEPKPFNPMMIKMKREFIQENFVIESSQKEAFWNAYNEYEKEIITAHKEQREFRKKNNIPSKMTADSLSNLSDEAILSYYKNNFETKNKLFKAEENFFNKLRNILKPQQIAQYYILEKNFHKSAAKMDKGPKMKMEEKPTKMEAKPMKMEEKPMKMEAKPANTDIQGPAKKQSGTNH